MRSNTGPLPEGLVFVPEFLSPGEEIRLLEFFRTLEFGSFEMRGVQAKRRLVHFGWRYSFDSYRLTEAPPVPVELQPLRDRAAALAEVAPEDFAEALVMEYDNGAGIGWHRDAPPFGIVAGISLGNTCRMRFQRGKGEERVTAALDLPPRSIYLLTGDARTKWEHTIPATRELRYSITFRTLRRKRD